MGDILTIRKLKNSDFFEKYKDSINCVNEALLPFAILFLNCRDKTIQKLGYKIILNYSNMTKNYIPLYEASYNLGLFPICNIIYKNIIQFEDLQESFMSLWLDSFSSLAKINGVTRTVEQINMLNFFERTLLENVCIVAPTSYGKSELIISLIKSSYNKNICILVPTKALISQTRKLIITYIRDKYKKEFLDINVITHPDMMNEKRAENNVIAIFTQERLMRYIKQYKKPMFDFLIVDEAHEMLTANSRSELLALAILLVKKRNPKTIIKYLTPFISDSDNLEIKYMEALCEPFKVDELVKSPRYKFVDLSTLQSYYYDQYFNEFIVTDGLIFNDSIESYIISESSKSALNVKSLVYLNKARDIEQVAMSLARTLPEIKDDGVEAICNALNAYLDKEYNLIECLKHGVVYHHGSMPDNIRSFVEYIYSNDENINYLVTSSTLLQGVNLPINELYILDIKKGRRNLSASSFRNLVGRVGRFKEIFKGGKDNLLLLQPYIHIVKSRHMQSNADIKGFLKTVANEGGEVEDRVDNTLLKKSLRNLENENNDIFENIIENNFPGSIPNYDKPLLSTKIGKICILNGFNEFNVLDKEQEMQEICDKYSNINSVSVLIEAIDQIFIHFLPEQSRSNSKRLRNQKAKEFYTMMLDKRLESTSFKQMIALFINYWKRQDEELIYVGHKWGEVSRDNPYKKMYVRLTELNDAQLINLAIVRIKEEEDFIDYSILRYVELLKDAELLNKDFYLILKYGSNDISVIELIQLGFSSTLAKVIVQKYSKYIEYKDGIIQGVSESILDKMEDDGYNSLQLFEVRSHL
ncbi:DEAD/DEAH box helicase [Veillonella caviae]|uniref:DEAD/DEAH box helicase n=1 Tax=Veillonella caviae TaxID=248316 RepID=UPI002A9099B3|nr:DEAD/DEAH box helicase [Veillonella caviae]MDY5787948.1 DEAD/DEAH box helicase family protein [Veillonella caviae]